MIRYAAACIALVAAAPAWAQIAEVPDENPWTAPLVDDFVYGIYCAEEPAGQEPAPETASGVVNIVPNLPEMRLTQLVVPAARDIGFGVLLRLRPGEARDVTVTVTHPPFPGNGIEVERWQTSFDGSDYSLNGFTFDSADEEVPGTWTFSAEADGELIYHIAFEVVPGTALPAVVALCSGGLTS